MGALARMHAQRTADQSQEPLTENVEHAARKVKPWADVFEAIAPSAAGKPAPKSSPAVAASWTKAIAAVTVGER